MYYTYVMCFPIDPLNVFVSLYEYFLCTRKKYGFLFLLTHPASKYKLITKQINNIKILNKYYTKTNLNLIG